MQTQCQILSEDEKQTIHRESLRILEEIGILFHSRKALRILESNGAKVDWETRIARIRGEMVNQALGTAPKSFTLGARVAENNIEMPSSYSGYVLDNGGIYIRDFKTGERRTIHLQDHIELIKVFEAMENASILWPSTIEEFPPHIILVKTAISSFIHSSLHVQDELYRPGEVPFLLEALETILGSADAVRERKIYSVVYCTIPPRSHEGNMCDAYLELMDYEVPICVYPMPCAGSTGPASLFSNIAMANAEGLSALVLFQMAKPGTPIIFGDACGSTDFKTGNFLEGSPEMVLQTGARGEMAKFYGLPNELAGCLTDAREHGPQAVMEKFLTTLPLVLNGTDLIQGPGALETSNTMSLEQIVVDDEIASLCGRFRTGVDVSPAKNYFEDIATVKPGGHFLARPNTRTACRGDEFSVSALCDRGGRQEWAMLGQPGMYAKARRKVEEILSSPQKNPLPEDIIGKLDEIVRKADLALARNSL